MIVYNINSSVNQIVNHTNAQQVLYMNIKKCESGIENYI